VTNESNPDGIGLGGASGAPIVNQAPAQPDPGSAPTGAAPSTQIPIDPGDQTAQPPRTELVQPAAQPQPQQDVTGTPANDVQAATIAPTTTSPDPAAPNQPVPDGVSSDRVTQTERNQPVPNQGVRAPTAQGTDNTLPLMRMLALKLLVDNGGQVPDLGTLEGSVQRVLEHVQGHAGRMGLLGTAARSEDQLPKTMATLLAYGLVATVGMQPNLDPFQQGVEQLVRWAHDVA
jgi:hypothetical protein